METLFRLRRGSFEVEVAGPRAFVEGQLDAHLERWLSLAGAACLEPDGESQRRLTGPSAGIDTESTRTESDDTKNNDFPRVAPDFRPKVNVTIGEFLAMKEAVEPADMVVVAVYYLDRYLQKDTFVPADLQDLLGPLPAWACRRAEDELEAVLARGHVEQLRDGRFTITYKGQNYVREGLSG